MISTRCFQATWIREQAAALRARDLRTLEKNILALELVSRLGREGLEFIFKGGTSLALFFEPVRRLSIDVDILSLEPIERLKAVLDRATTGRPPFNGYEHQESRDREAPPTVHFRIPYSSALDSGGVHTIQLDVITAVSPRGTTRKSISSAMASGHSTVTFSTNRFRMPNHVSLQPVPLLSRSGCDRRRMTLTCQHFLPPKSISIHSAMPILTVRGAT